jgi:hypothetical protein
LKHLKNFLKRTLVLTWKITPKPLHNGPQQAELEDLHKAARQAAAAAAAPGGGGGGGTATSSGAGWEDLN